MPLQFVLNRKNCFFKVKQPLDLIYWNFHVIMKQFLTRERKTMQWAYNCDPFVSFPEFAIDNMPRPRKKLKNKNIKLKFAAKTDSIQTTNTKCISMVGEFCEKLFSLALTIFYFKQFIKPAILLLSVKNINILFYKLVKVVFQFSLLK